MIDTFEIEWKIGGLLPAPIRSTCKYYQTREDPRYANRVFDRPDLEIPSNTLVPTKLFHQALRGELAKRYELSEAIHTLPYRLPIGDLGAQFVNLRFRVFDKNFLVLTIHIPQNKTERSISELIQLQILSSNPILESVARFCFNVHYCPEPSQMAVMGWLSKPLLKVWDNSNKLTQSSLVELVTRHEGLNKRAMAEMISKNEALNFNEDILLLDKQGVVFLCSTSEKISQRNRYKRISSLYEFAVHAQAVEAILAEGSEKTTQKSSSNIKSIKEVLDIEVLSKSVSSKRGWELIKSEFKLGRIVNKNQTNIVRASEQSQFKKTPFYLNPVFIGISAILALLASVATIYQVFN